MIMIMSRGADMYRDIDAAELAGRLGTDREPLVLDIRDPDEVAECGQFPDR